jgi:hypothetical protein
MNSSMTGTALVRFLALELWLVAVVCLVMQLVEWMRIRTATAESLDDKYFIASTSHWLLAAVVLGLMGVLVYVGTTPLARWVSGER